MDDLTDKYRDSGGDSKNTFDLGRICPLRGDTAVPLHKHEERILDSLRRRLQSESNDFGPTDVRLPGAQVQWGDSWLQ